VKRARPSLKRGRRPVVGVVGAGAGASRSDERLAERLGRLLAEQGWIVLTGGRDCGVMAAACRGAKQVDGALTIGILPSESGPVAADVDLAVFTGMGNARNAVNVLTSDVVVACGAGGPGTASEVALALKCARPVVLLAAPRAMRDFVRTLGGRSYATRSAHGVVALIRREKLLDR
jgi:uncharacterized protein (TIGR00725 family)